MSAAALGLAALAWLCTYLVHSTVFLGGTWALCAACKRLPLAWQDRLWKLALVGGLATASLQAGLGLEPIGGRVRLAAGERSARADGGGSAPAFASSAHGLPVDGGGARSRIDAEGARLLPVLAVQRERASSAPTRPARRSADAPADARRDAGVPAAVAGLMRALPLPYRVPFASAGEASTSWARSRRAVDEPRDPLAITAIEPIDANLATKDAEPVPAHAARKTAEAALESPDAARETAGAAHVPSDVERATAGAALATADATRENAGAAIVPADAVLEIEGATALQSAAAAPTARRARDLRPWASALGALWAAAAALGLLAFLRAHRRLRAQLSDRVVLESGPLRARLDALAARAGLRGRVRLSVSARVPAPITHGVLRREICVPLRALSDLSPRQQEALLGHELGHALRRDPAWLALCWLLERVLLVQPLNRVARARLAEGSELLCDDWAVHLTGRRLPLASCLTEVAQWVVGARVLALPAAGMAARGAMLTRRVERLLAAPPREVGRRARWWPIGALAALGVVAGGAPGFAAALREPAARPEPAARLERAVERAAPAEHVATVASVATAEHAVGPVHATDQAVRPDPPAPIDARAVAAAPGRLDREAPARRAPAARPACDALLAELDLELALAESELRDLLRELADRGGHARHAERLRAIQDGLADLRSKRETIGSLLPHVLDALEDRDPTPFSLLPVSPLVTRSDER